MTDIEEALRAQIKAQAYKEATVQYTHARLKLEGLRSGLTPEQVTDFAIVLKASERNLEGLAFSQVLTRMEPDEREAFARLSQAEFHAIDISDQPVDLDNDGVLVKSLNNYSQIAQLVINSTQQHTLLGFPAVGRFLAVDFRYGVQLYTSAEEAQELAKEHAGANGQSAIEAAGLEFENGMKALQDANFCVYAEDRPKIEAIFDEAIRKVQEESVLPQVWLSLPMEAQMISFNGESKVLLKTSSEAVKVQQVAKLALFLDGADDQKEIAARLVRAGQAVKVGGEDGTDGDMVTGRDTVAGDDAEPVADRPLNQRLLSVLRLTRERLAFDNRTAPTA